MLNKTKVALLGAMGVAAFTSTGAQAATASAEAQAKIIPAVTLVQTNALDFGTIAPAATPGTVVIPITANTRTCTTVTCAGGTVSRGIFRITGAAGNTVVISVPATITLKSGTTNTMSLALTATPSIATTSINQLIYVGGTLTVGANQPAGDYAETYNVTADYQ